MKVGAAFPGQFIKAADLQGKRVQVVIDSVTMEDIGGETKPILHFRGKERGMVLNKTNANAIWGLTGSDETDDWAGTSLTLFSTKVEFQGKRVDAIRIDPPDRPPQQLARRPVPPPPPPVQDAEVTTDDDDSDSCPF